MTLAERIASTIENLEYHRYEINNNCADLEILRKMELDKTGETSISAVAIASIDKCVLTLHVALDALHDAQAQLSNVDANISEKHV